MISQKNWKKDVAGEIISKSHDMGIIFLTISSKYAVAVFAMNTIHYLLKLFSQEQFDIAMYRAVKKVVYYDVISLSCVDGVYRVCISEIVFIESQGHYMQPVLLVLAAMGMSAACLKIRVLVSPVSLPFAKNMTAI